MAIKLHRCPSIWAKTGSHPCWKVLVPRAVDGHGTNDP
jgi:hypothetical protein